MNEQTVQPYNALLNNHTNKQTTDKYKMDASPKGYVKRKKQDTKKLYATEFHLCWKTQNHR